MTPQRLLITVAVLGLAAFLLRRNLWRALLVFWPSRVRVEAEDPGAAKEVADPLRPAARELGALGFVPLGTHSEHPPLGPQRLCWNFSHPEAATVATLYEARDGSPQLYFLSVLAGGGYVISSNFRRPAKDVPGRYVSGWLEDIPLERLYRAHARRTAGLEVERPPVSLDGRVELQRAWYGGPGRAEVRQQHVQGLLWTLGTLGMVAGAIFAGDGR